MKNFASLILAAIITVGLGFALNYAVISNHKLEQANE